MRCAGCRSRGRSQMDSGRLTSMRWRQVFNVFIVFIAFEFQKRNTFSLDPRHVAGCYGEMAKNIYCSFPLEYAMRRVLHQKSKRWNIWNKFGRLRFGILEAQQNHQGRRGMEAWPLPGLGRPWAVWSPRSTQPVDAKVIADTFSAFKGLAPITCFSW